MRFGKRLAEVTQRSRANEPYVSYKELKHVVRKLATLIGEGGWSVREDDSSADEVPGRRQSGQGFSSAASSAAASSAAAASALPSSAIVPSLMQSIEADQKEFFDRLTADIAAAKLYIQGVVTSLEALVGDWQCAAISAGLLFTPEQLEDIQSQLPFSVEDQKVLVEWLLSMQPPASQDVRNNLLQKYSTLATNLNELLQFIEVNLTAVRKIFKKFEKKVPTELRMQTSGDFRAHHDFFLPNVQQVLRTAVQIQRLLASTVLADLGPEATATAVPISQIGPESLSLLNWLRATSGLEEMLGTASVARINVLDLRSFTVYAKPTPELQVQAAAGAAKPQQQVVPAASASGGLWQQGWSPFTPVAMQGGYPAGAVQAGHQSGAASSSAPGPSVASWRQPGGPPWSGGGVGPVAQPGTGPMPSAVDPFQGPPNPNSSPPAGQQGAAQGPGGCAGRPPTSQRRRRRRCAHQDRTS